MSIGRLHEIDAALAARAAAAPRRTSGVMKLSVPNSSSSPHRPQLLKSRALLGVLLGGGRRAVADVPCAGRYRRSTRSYRRRAMGSAAVEYDPFSPEVMADPYPIYRELRARHRAFRMRRVRRVGVAALRRRVERARRPRALLDRRGPGLPPRAAARHNDGAPDTTRAAAGAQFSMLDPPHHTRLRQAMIDPFRPARGRAGSRTTCARSPARSSTSWPERGGFDVRHDYASPVAAAVARSPDRPAASDGVSLVDAGESLRRSASRTRPGSAPRAWRHAREIDDYLGRLRRRPPARLERRRSTGSARHRRRPARVRRRATARSTTPR